MKRTLSLACLFLLPVTVLAQNRGTASSNTCDRECLRGFITQYLDAMIAHNPKTLPTAATARFTEDTTTVEISAFGGSVILKTRVRRGQRLVLSNLQTKVTVECLVAHAL